MKNTALNKSHYFLVRHGWRKKISQAYGLSFALVLADGFCHAYANINPILIYGVRTSDKQSLPCYAVINGAINFSINTQRFILKTEIACIAY